MQLRNHYLTAFISQKPLWLCTVPVGPVNGLELPAGLLRSVKETGGDRIPQDSDGPHCYNEINKQISKGLHSFCIFHRKSEQIYSDSSWSSQQVWKWPWKFFLMSSNNKGLIKWVSTGFGLCPKRERGGCMAQFQQWDKEKNSGPVRHFCPTTILQQPREKKNQNQKKQQEQQIECIVTWKIPQGLCFGFTFCLIMQHRSRRNIVLSCGDTSGHWKVFWISVLPTLKVSCAKLNLSIGW